MDSSSIIKKRPDLVNYPDIESKFTAMIDFLSMDRVLLNVPNMPGFTGVLIYDRKFQVENLIGPQPSYIKSTLKEWIKSFPQTANDLLSSEKSSDEITECLEKIRRQAFELYQKSDLLNDLTFDESFRYYVEHDGVLHNIPYIHLDFLPEPYNELIRHFELRSLFFLQITYIAEEKLKLHLQPLPQKKNLYIWDSPTAELEISELLFVLHVLTQRIKPNSDSGGTYAKFKREFFGLFGLSDRHYNKKMETIHKRQYKEHFVDDLAKKLNEFNAKQTENDEIKSD